MLQFVTVEYLKGIKKKNEFREVHYEFQKVRDIEVKITSKEITVDKNDTDYITKAYSCLSFEKDLEIGDFIKHKDQYFMIKSKKELRMNKYVLEVYYPDEYSVQTR